MRFSLITSLALATALAACQTTTMEPEAVAPSTATRLETQSDMAAITGKMLVLEAGKSYVIGADGTIRGTWDGAPLVGAYEMRDGFFCRTLSQGPGGPSGEDCQILTLDGDKLMGNRNRGDWASFTLNVM